MDFPRPRVYRVHPTHVGAATNPLHVVGRSGVDTWQQGKAASSSSSSRRPRPRPSPATSARDYDVEASVGHIRDLPNPSRAARRHEEGPVRQVRASTSTTASSPTTSSTPTRRRRSPSSSGCSRTPTSSTSPPMRTARARPSRGTCSRCSSRKVPVKRMVFHEITQEAIQRAVTDTRELDTAPRRRPGDPPHPRPALRLRGVARCCGARSARACPPAACSPSRPAWSSSASASGWRSGPASYWDVEGDFTTRSSSGALVEADAFTARLSAVDGRPRRHRPRLRRRRRAEAQVGRPPRRGDGARRSPTAVQEAPVVVTSVEEKPYTRRPAAPFTTSTLQQEASPQAAAVLARTPCASRSGSTRTATSPTCVPTRPRCRRAALTAARSQARDLYGADYVPAAPRRYAKQGQERAGGPRGDPPGRRPVPHARRRWPVSCAATSSRSTS